VRRENANATVTGVARGRNGAENQTDARATFGSYARFPPSWTTLFLYIRRNGNARYRNVSFVASRVMIAVVTSSPVATTTPLDPVERNNTTILPRRPKTVTTVFASRAFSFPLTTSPRRRQSPAGRFRTNCCVVVSQPRGHSFTG